MTAVVVLVFVGVWLFGLALMTRIDAGLARLKPESPARGEKLPEADAPLLFCDDEAMAEAVHERVPELMIRRTAELPPNARPRVLIALLSDDTDNLLLCRLARRARAGCVTVARCGDPTFLPVFKRAQVSRVLIDPPTPQGILSIVREGTVLCASA